MSTRRSLARSFGGGGTIYDTAAGVYSLRKYFGWSNAVLRIRRSSDDTLAYVFFDGATSYDTITLNSYISTSSDTTPDATTLGTWLGSDNAFVYDWSFQTPDNIIDADLIPLQATNSKQPTFATSGVINTYNGNIALSFNSGSLQFLARASRKISALDSTNDFTIFTVSQNSTSALYCGIFSTYETTNRGFQVFNDNSINKRIILQRGASGTAYITDYLAQQNVTTQKLITTIHNSTDNIAYYNNVIQNTTSTSGDSFDNIDIIIGSSKTSFSFLNGTIQEIIIFPSDKTSDLSEIHTELNDYYSIY